MSDIQLLRAMRLEMRIEARSGTCSTGGAPGTGVSSAYVILDLYQEAHSCG